MSTESKLILLTLFIISFVYQGFSLLRLSREERPNILEVLYYVTSLAICGLTAIIFMADVIFGKQIK